MLLSATSNGVGVNVRLVGYGLSVSRYQGIYTGHRAFGTTVGHTNSNCRSLGIVVDDWGIGREVEVSGARIGNASVTR